MRKCNTMRRKKGVKKVKSYTLNEHQIKDMEFKMQKAFADYGIENQFTNIVERTFKELLQEINYKEMIVYSSNERLNNPQFYKGETAAKYGIASAEANHLVFGGVDVHGKFVGNEDNMINELKEKKGL